MLSRSFSILANSLSVVFHALQSIRPQFDSPETNVAKTGIKDAASQILFYVFALISDIVLGLRNLYAPRPVFALIRRPPARTNSPWRLAMKTPRILVVDDDRDFAESMADALLNRGYGVTIALSGEDALAQFDREKPDLVFLDIRLPGIDGVQTFSAMRRRFPEIRVAMMTGYSVKELLDEALANGAWAVLHKPFHFERALELARKIKPHRILVASARREFREGMREMLERNGYMAMAADHGEAAMRLAEENRPSAAILDSDLAPRGGLDALKQLELAGLGCPALLVVEDAAPKIGRIAGICQTRVLSRQLPAGDFLDAIEDMTRHFEEPH